MRSKKRMDISGYNIRKCSVRQCDLDSRRRAPQAEDGVAAVPYGLVVPATLHTSGHIEVIAGHKIPNEKTMLGELGELASKAHKSEPLYLKKYTEMPAMAIKMEPDTEDAFITQEAGVGFICIPESIRADFGWFIKEEDDFIVKTEDDADEIIIKQELDIEPTVLQPQAALRMPSPSTQMAPDLHPCMSSGGSRASTPLCTVPSAPQKQGSKPEDDCYQEGSGVPPGAGSMLDSKSKGDCYQGLLEEHSYALSGRQSEDRCRCCIMSRTAHFINHIHNYASQKLHKCERCKYCTSQLRGEKHYKCEQCVYSSSQLDDLTFHMRIHTGEWPYKCEQCGYSATELHNLKVHMRIHCNMLKLQRL